MIHTGNITHLSKPTEFDDAQGVISKVGLDVHYVPGEHGLLDEDAKLYRERYAHATAKLRRIEVPPQLCRAAPTLRGLRPLARVEATCTGIGISPGWAVRESPVPS